MKGYKVGLGFDVHRLSKKKKDLILGGAKVTSSFSLIAVSDGDVVLHAVSDALCGAACLGDIGDYFPPQDKKSKGIDSKEILSFVLKKVKRNTPLAISILLLSLISRGFFLIRERLLNL